MIGDPQELSFLYSGGIRLDAPFRPQLLYELAKMDGAIIVDAAVKRLAWANVQLMPDPTIPSDETGTRHRTAERVAKQTGALVVSVSQQRETVTIFVGPARYQLDPVADVLAKTNQALGTLETYRQRLEQVLTRLTALEFQNAVVLDDVLVTLQRAEMTSRMAERIERDCVELGSEGRLIRLQLEELVGNVPAERDAIVRDYHAVSADGRGDARARGPAGAPLPGPARVRPARRAARLPARLEPARHARCSRAATASSRTSRGSRSRSSGGSSPTSARLDTVVRASQRDLEAVEGVGRRPGPRDPRGPAAAPGAQSRRPLPPAVALSAKTRKSRVSRAFLLELALLGPAPVAPALFGGKRRARGEDRLVQGRRQGGVSAPRCRDGRQEGVARGPGTEARVPDDQDPAQRHDRAGPVRERRPGRPPAGHRREGSRRRAEGADGRLDRDAEELEPPLQAQPRQDEDGRRPRARRGRAQPRPARSREGSVDRREADVREGEEDPRLRADVRQEHGRGRVRRVARGSARDGGNGKKKTTASKKKAVAATA